MNKTDISYDALEFFSKGGGQDVTLLLTGSSGQGKTRLLSRLVKHLAEGQPGQLLLVLRYIGSSGDSSTALGLARSICRQLGSWEPVSDREIAASLVYGVKSYLSFYPQARLLLVLDGLDQFTDHRDQELRWLIPFLRDISGTALTAELKSRCRVLVTVLPSPLSPAELAITRGLDFFQRMALAPLTEDECDVLLQKLSTQHPGIPAGLKALDAQQAKLVASCFKIAKEELSGISPLIMHLLAVTYLHEKPSNLPKFLPSTAAECFEAWLGKLEKKLAARGVGPEGLQCLKSITLLRSGLPVEFLKEIAKDAAAVTSIEEELRSHPYLISFYGGCWRWDHKVAHDVAFFRYFGVDPLSVVRAKRQNGATAKETEKELDATAHVLLDLVLKQQAGLPAAGKPATETILQDLPRLLSFLDSTATTPESSKTLSNLETLQRFTVSCGTSSAAARELSAYISRSRIRSPQSSVDALEGFVEIMTECPASLDVCVAESAGYAWFAQTAGVGNGLARNGLQDLRTAVAASAGSRQAFVMFSVDVVWASRDAIGGGGGGMAEHLPDLGDLVSTGDSEEPEIISLFSASKNGKVIVAVVGESEVRGWDAITFSEQWTTLLTERIDAVAVSPNGSLVAFGTSSGISIYRAYTGRATAMIAPLAGTPTNTHRLKIQHLSFAPWASIPSAPSAARGNQDQEDQGPLLASARFGHLLLWRLEMDGSTPEIITCKEDAGEEGRQAGYASARFAMSPDGSSALWWREDPGRGTVVKAYGVNGDVKTPGSLGMNIKWRHEKLDADVAGRTPVTVTADGRSVVLVSDQGTATNLTLATGERAWTVGLLQSFNVADRMVDVHAIGALLVATTRSGWVLVMHAETGKPLLRQKVSLMVRCGEDGSCRRTEEVIASVVIARHAWGISSAIVVATSFGRLTVVGLPLAVSGLVRGEAWRENGDAVFKALDAGPGPVHYLAWSGLDGLLVADSHFVHRVRRITGARPSSIQDNNTPQPPSGKISRVILAAEVQIQSAPAALCVEDAGRIAYYARTTTTSSLEPFEQGEPGVCVEHGTPIRSACIVDSGKSLLVLDKAGGLALYPHPTSLSATPQGTSANPDAAAPPSATPQALWRASARLRSPESGEEAIGVFWGANAPFNFHVVTSFGQVQRYKQATGEYLGALVNGSGVLRDLFPPSSEPVIASTDGASATPQAAPPPPPPSPSKTINRVVTWSRSPDGRTCALGDTSGGIYVVRVTDPGATPDPTATHVSLPAVNWGGAVMALCVVPLTSLDPGGGTGWAVVACDWQGLVVVWEVRKTGAKAIGSVYLGTAATAMDVAEVRGGGVKVAMGCSDGRILVYVVKAEGIAPLAPVQPVGGAPTAAGSGKSSKK
ncbi:hypothetical protein HDU96_002577 [Phlyctochytrium bullatum]|nr:hypothetical protein HDU96_002577 [Phlyctochytrium bullatum]